MAEDVVESAPEEGMASADFPWHAEFGFEEIVRCRQVT
jgi:hypothetical protein